MAIAPRAVLRRSFVGGRLVKRHFIDGQPADLPAVAEAVAPKVDEPAEVEEPVDLMNDENDALVEGTLADIIPTLGDKTPAELEALKAAETDRELPRKGLLAAIDKALADKAE